MNRSSELNGEHRKDVLTYPGGGTAPLLKWPGGKRALTKFIWPLVPNKFNRYYEPFLGGGALFFALGPHNATLSDTNQQLIEMYQQVRDRPTELIKLLKNMRNSEREYYRVRLDSPQTPLKRAARLIYLCTLSFNGIHRCNLKGEFNVPYGYKTHLRVCDEDRVQRASRHLRNAKLVAADFEKIAAKADRGDLIYFDPPYTVAHNNNGFVKYNSSIFSWRDQLRLAEVANDARRRGCSVLVSNADHECVKTLYPDFMVTTIDRYSIIASKSRFRRPITENLFWSVVP